jgi:hypothetical protein
VALRPPDFPGFASLPYHRYNNDNMQIASGTTEDENWGMLKQVQHDNVGSA